MTTIQQGRSIEDVIEREAGCLYYHAVLLSDLSSNLEAAAETYSHSDDLPSQELARRCRELGEFMDTLSLTEAGEITLHRECRRCSGTGHTTGEDPCGECGGRGYVHAEEADG